MKPDDTCLHIRGGGRLMPGLQKVLHGRASLDDVSTGPDDDLAIARLLDAFGRQGLLALPAESRGSRDRLGQPRIAVEGDNPLGQLVVELLAPHATLTVGALNPDVVSGSDVVIAVAGWLPDAHWRQVDGWCNGAEVAFHRCHAEGTRFFVGPCSVPGTTASYADTRARRLAAADKPDELEHYWTYLDSAQPKPHVPWPTVGGIALIAGILVADTLALVDRRPLPSGGCQLEVDAATCTVLRHPVLPIPQISSMAIRSPALRTLPVSSPAERN
jgi:hypothetical protein